MGKVILEWEYSAADCLEERVEIEHAGCSMTIDNGKAEARIDAEVFDRDPSIRQRLHDDLNDRLLGAQLQSHRPYQLSKSRMIREEAGQRKIYAEFHATAKASASFEIKVLDVRGNVVLDSRTKRIDDKRNLGALIHKRRANDSLAAALLDSYKAAVDDPENELVHLYEIRDALKAKFGNERVARAQIGVSHAEWSRFGLLANDEPLRQGRHRGTNAGGLRDATESELQEVRQIARKMILGYLGTLP